MALKTALIVNEHPLPDKVVAVNLNDTNDKGEFVCPQCRELISPSDESGESYTLYGFLFAEGELAGIFIQCTCGQRILMTLPLSFE